MPLYSISGIHKYARDLCGVGVLFQPKNFRRDNSLYGCTHMFNRFDRQTQFSQTI
jgi:hypothetical protein